MDTPAPIGKRSSAPPGAYKPPALLGWLYRRFFRHIHVDEQWSRVVRESANRGVVVYVMRSLSFLDFLCLDWLVKRFALPLVRFVNDLGLWILEPFGRGERRLRFRRLIPETTALAEVVRSDFSALLFLRRPPKFGRASPRGEKLEADLILTLVETQRDLKRPILLVPQTFVWGKLPSRQRRTLLDFWFGPIDWPGKIRVFFQFLFNYRNALLRSGEPFDLREFVERHPGLSDKQIADKVRYALLRRIERERTLVLGPAQKTPARIRDELLRSPRVRKHIESAARAQKKPVAKIVRQARKDLRQLCANQNPIVLAIFSRLLRWVFTRIYDGVVVDQSGLVLVREAARKGAIVFVPSHKSHVDYLILNYVLYQHAFSPPLIAAGDNLNFWPIGGLLRRSGAFFIRRSFRGRKLYAALVDAYLRKLIVEGFPIEFFIEGGRSRTGKLLTPKYGLLSMLIDAALLLPGRKVHLIPVAISYERIVEQTSYVHELSGGEKQRENLGGLLKTTEVLRSKYGRLYVQFGNPIAIDEAEVRVRETNEVEEDTLPPPARRALIQNLGQQVIDEIHRATVATPAAIVATALLSHRRRGMLQSELTETAQRLVASLDGCGAHIAPQTRGPDGTIRQDILTATVDLFVDAKLVERHEAGAEPIYRLPHERRIALEYYKNNVIHFFVDRALIAVSLTEEPNSVATLRERFRSLATLFRHEFSLGDKDSLDHHFEAALEAMLLGGEIEDMADHVAPNRERRDDLELYSRMIHTYFEAYVLALRNCQLLQARPMTRKEWIKRGMELGSRMFLAGEIDLRESISRSKLEAALHGLKEAGVFRFGPNETVLISEEITAEEAEALRRKLASFLR